MQQVYTRLGFTITTFVTDGALTAQSSPIENNGLSFIRIYFRRVDWIELAERWVHLCILF
jgi:hypothetical protein